MTSWLQVRVPPIAFRRALGRGVAAALAAATILVGGTPSAAADSPTRSKEPTLEARAVLPAATFFDGPASGQFIGAGPFNGISAPFAHQPVQGFSAVLDGGRGTYWALSDNGYGAKANSADFLLRLYHLRPAWETKSGGPGTIGVLGYISLRDPHHEIPWAIVNDATPERLLTGADFDIESVRIDRHGDLWFGDEFGPFLLHADSKGRLLEAPIPLPGVKSPSNPTLAPGELPNLLDSRGFEGMAIAPGGTILYPMLEGALTTDPDQRHRSIFEFAIKSGKFTGRSWNYRVAQPGYSIGDLTALDRHRLLVIERDNLQGPAAAFKKVFEVDLRDINADGFLRKREIVDLLAISDPAQISLPARTGDIGLGTTFTFPFQTIESILPLPGGRLLMLNDNNFPFSAGRNPGLPDDDEAIILRVPGLTSDAAGISDVYPYAETRPIYDLDTDDPVLPAGGKTGDADDPSFWIPKDPSKTRIITSLKDGGLEVYDLHGTTLQTIAPDDIRYNNVDTVQDVRVGGRRHIDLAVASDRRNDLLAIYQIDHRGQLTDVSDPASPLIFTPAGQASDQTTTTYGLALAQVVPWSVDVFVTRRASQEIAQLRLVPVPGGKIGWTVLRTFQLPIPADGEVSDAQSEGLVFDSETGTLYIGQENVGVWSARADWRTGAGSVTTRLIHPTKDADPDALLTSDVEGLTIRYGRGRDPDLMLVSSQGDNSFAVFGRDRGRAGAFTRLVGRFTVADIGGIDGAQESDGAAVTSARLGKGLPDGLLVVQDGSNEPSLLVDDDGELENVSSAFKLVDWREVERALGLR